MEKLKPIYGFALPSYYSKYISGEYYIHEYQGNFFVVPKDYEFELYPSLLGKENSNFDREFLQLLLDETKMPV